MSFMAQMTKTCLGRDELKATLQEKIAHVKDQDSAISLIAEIGQLERLSLSPFAGDMPLSYKEWIDFLASLENWSSVSKLSKEKQLYLLFKVKILFSIYENTISDPDFMEPLFRLISTGQQNNDDNINYLLSLALQLPDFLAELEFDSDSVDKIIKAIDFFEQYETVKDSPEDLEKLLNSFNLTDSATLDRGEDLNLKDPRSDLKELARKFDNNELSPLEVLKILKIHIGSEKTPEDHSESKEYPVDLTSWLRYVIRYGHTHSFGAFVSDDFNEADAVARIMEFGNIIKKTLPLFAIADNLSNWELWQGYMNDPLVASVTLIAFESKTEEHKRVLNEVRGRMNIEGDIFNLIFCENDFTGLKEKQINDILHYRELFLGNLQSLE